MNKRRELLVHPRISCASFTRPVSSDTETSFELYRALRPLAVQRDASERERLALPPLGGAAQETFAVDVETCPRCGGRIRLLAVITDLTQVARFLHHRREPTEPPARAPPRGPPYFKTSVVRRRQPSEPSTQGERFEEH